MFITIFNSKLPIISKFNKRQVLSLAFITTLFIFAHGCIPNESPIAPHQHGDVKVGTAEMGNLYANQIYFNLAFDSVVSTNKFADWDLAFCSFSDSFAVIINTARSMKVLNTHKVNFNDVSSVDTNNVDESVWSHDNPEGKLDSTAIGQWWENIKMGEVISKSEVYIVDRGVNEKGKASGLVKLQILGYENDSYFIKFANLNDTTNIKELEIKKNPFKNFVQISLNNSGTVVDLEPANNLWDICFTKYTDKVYANDGSFLWYGVTGPLINRQRVTVALAPDSVFENVDYGKIKDLTFSSFINAIGYDWKLFDFNNGFYLVNPKKIYIIQTPLGYYKLHFVDFYDKTGEKGYPKFEYQKLKLN